MQVLSLVYSHKQVTVRARTPRGSSTNGLEPPQALVFGLLAFGFWLLALGWVLGTSFYFQFLGKGCPSLCVLEPDQLNPKP